MVDLVESTAGLNLFGKPQVNKRVDRGYYQDIRPINVHSHAGPIEFDLSSTDYLQSPLTYLEIDMRILKEVAETGAKVRLKLGDQISTCNMPAHSLFSSIAISSRSEVVSDMSSNLYPYKAYLETLMNYSPFMADGHLKCSGFELDTPGKYEFIKDDFTNGAGKRSKQWNLSAWNTFIIPLHLDMLNTLSNLPGGMDLKLIFTRKPDNFTLLKHATDETNYHIELRDLKIRCRRIVPNSQIRLQHELAFEKGDAEYDFSLTVLKEVSLTSNNILHVVPNIFRGKVPPLLLIGLMESAAIVGNAKLNPFNFEHHNVKTIALKIGGSIRPLQPHAIDWATGGGVRKQYRQFNEMIGVRGMNASTFFTYDFYKKGGTIFAYDNTPEGYVHDVVQNPTEDAASVDLEITLATANTKSLTLIALGIYDRSFYVNKDRDLINPRLAV